jgi:hypothetical protein
VIRTSIRRAFVGALLLLALGGPSPGAVGSCGGEISTADPVQFCANRRVAECSRALARGDALPPAPTPCVDDPATAYNESEPPVCNWVFCVQQVPNRCSMASWAGCNPPPTQAIADDCLAALTSVERLPQPTAEIAECNLDVICPSGAALLESLTEEGAAIDDSVASSEEVP